MGTPYTVLGTTIWSWKAFRDLSSDAKVMYLALYSCPQTKNICPGLFHGGLGTLSEATSLPPQQTFDALQELIDHHLAEWDREHMVIRLTTLPDDLERPSNPNVIHGWWKRFQSVPACGVRDAHVAVIRGLIDAFEEGEGKPGASDKREEAWGKTFASIKLRANRHRGQRAVLAESTAPPNQVELFSPSPKGNGSGNRSRNGLGNPLGSGEGSGEDQERVSLAEGTGSHTPVPAAEPEPDADPVAMPPTVPEPMPPMTPAPELPLAKVVPLRGPDRPPLPFTIAQLVETLQRTSAGRFDGTSFVDAQIRPITETIRACADKGVTLVDVAAVGAWLAGGGMAWRKELLGPSWLAKPGQLLEAVMSARATARPPAPTISAPATTGESRARRRRWDEPS